MRNIISFFFFLIASSVSGQTDFEKLDSVIKNIPGITVKGEYAPRWWNMKMYLLNVRQPKDHKDTTKGFFHQRVMLRSRGFDRPNIIETEGYELAQGEGQLERILNANQIDIEQRYLGKSIPDTSDWTYATYEQCAADWHHIKQILQTVYTGKWISTGTSRGGQNTVFYKYYYPKDVDASVAFVTPIMTDRYSTAHFMFLDTMGSIECREKLLHSQILLLKHRNEFLDKLQEEYTVKNKLTFNYIGSIDKAFEYCLLDQTFSFWQSNDFPCDSIPEGDDINEHLKFFLNTSDVKYAADQNIKEWATHHYMAMTQGGYYAFNTKPYLKYLKYYGKNASPLLPPVKMQYNSFNSQFIKNVLKWTNKKAANMIFIYGAKDPYTVYKVNPRKENNSKVYIVPDKNHNDAQDLSNMPLEMQIDFANQLKKILNINVNMDAKPIKWQADK